MPYFYTPNERESKELFGALTIKTFWGEKMMLSLVEAPAYAAVPAHSHPYEEVGIVLEGDVTFTVGGETRLLKPGDLYVIPSGVEHSVIVGDQPAKALDIFSPVREEYQV